MWPMALLLVTAAVPIARRTSVPCRSVRPQWRDHRRTEAAVAVEAKDKTTPDRQTDRQTACLPACTAALRRGVPCVETK